MKKIKNSYPPVRDDIADLRTVRALPTQYIQHIDPFLFLNHHGHQIYTPHNRGLPFGPHPHRGFETVTFILKGDIAHRDSAGHESIIKEGGIQWMTAGKGLVHEEVSSEEFKKQGGELEILQLWINLPSHLKMTEPRYIGRQQDEIPTEIVDGVKRNFVSQAVTTLTDITLQTIEMLTESQTTLKIPPGQNVFFYVVKGNLLVNGSEISAPRLVEFADEEDEIEVKAQSQAYLLFGHATPFNEPIVSYGPFVMNTREEILAAIQDYEAGKFS